MSTKYMIAKYQAEAIRTLPTYGFEKDVEHCVLGMAGEVGEYLEATQSERLRDTDMGEIGDCFWYAVSLLHVLGDTLDSGVLNNPPRINNPFSAMVIQSAAMVDLVKKSIFYHKPLRTAEITTRTHWMIAALISECVAQKYPLSRVFNMNIAKLKARYPDKFNVDLANNRDHEAELKAMSQVGGAE